MKNKEDIEQNRWELPESVKEVLDFIAEATKNHPHAILDEGFWSWSRNGRCKYISLRFDMRTGAFTIIDRNKKRITMEELKYQYRTDDEKRREAETKRDN